MKQIKFQIPYNEENISNSNWKIKLFRIKKYIRTSLTLDYNTLFLLSKIQHLKYPKDNYIEIVEQPFNMIPKNLVLKINI